MSTIISAGTTTGTGIAITPDTSGNLAFQTQAGANTITVPNVTGTIVTNKTVGTVLQVVSTTSSTAFSTTSGSQTSTGIGLSITPTSSTSKILVRMTVSVVSGISGCGISIYRGTTPIYSPATADSYGFYGSLNAGAAAAWAMIPIEYLDSPATTSSVTYNLYVGSRLSATTYINQAGASNNGQTTITLMEIAA